MNLRMSSGRAAYIKQQNYAKMAASNIQRKFDNERYGKMKDAQRRSNQIKLKGLVDLCKAEFSQVPDVFATLQTFFSKWEEYKYQRNYNWGVESVRIALEEFSLEVRQKFEYLVEKNEVDFESKMKEIQKLKEREAFKKKYVELQQQRKHAEG